MPDSCFGPAEIRTLPNKVIAALRVLRERIQSTLPARWILLIAGIASIGYGQYLMEQRAPQGNPLPLAEFWNIVYRLEIVNFDNVLYALPYFIGGAILCALVAMPSTWKEPFVNWATRWPGRAEARWNFQFSRILIGIISIGYLLFQLDRHQYMPVYSVFWLVAISAFTQVFWNWDKSVKLELSPGISSLDLFWITGLLILGFSINSFALQDVPFTMVPDEGNFWETARAVALGDIHPAIFDSGVYTFPIASSTLQGWLLRIFGVNFWAWRFSSVIAGMFTVIPLYLLAKEWFGRHAAVAACIMMMSNPYFISFSRMGYNNSQSLFPVTLCIYFFATGARKGSIFYLWLAGIVAGVGFYTYFSAWLGLITLCFGVLYLLVIKEMQWRRAILTLGVILLAWAVVFTPRIAYTASGENSGGLVYKIFETSFVNTFYARVYYGEGDLAQTMPLIPFGERGTDTIFYDPVVYSELLLRGTVRTFLAIFNPYVVYEHFLINGLAGVITPVFFLVGLVLSLRYRKQLRFSLPLIWFLAGVFFLSVIGAFPPRHTHLVSVIPALALISGAGLAAVAESLTELTLSRWASLRSLARTSLMTIASLAIVYYGFQRYYVRMPLTYPPIFEDVASWIAWRTEKPVTLIYLSENETPHRIEYLVNSNIVPHEYQTALINDFATRDDLKINKPAIIFIEAPQSNLEIPLLKKPPRGYGQPVAYHHRDGQIIGYAMTNTSVDLNPKIGLADGLHSLIDKPVRYVLLTLIIMFVIFSGLVLRDSIGWPRKEFLFEIGKDQSKQEQADGQERRDKPEFNFHLRVRIPPRKRNQS